MTAFPIAASLAAARETLSSGSSEALARTEEEARAKAGGVVFLAVEELPEAFATPGEAEAAAPELYGSGLYELLWRDGAWRLALRFWRLAPPAPVARTVQGAGRKPLGHARTPEEARAVLGQPAEMAQELIPQFYRDRRRAMTRWGALVNSGLADIVEREGKVAVSLTYWRPMRAPGHEAPLAPAERSELAERSAAPLRAKSPQEEMDIGLFERLAPENPDIVLVADEGDGRFRGSE
jgi:hypothetical protein